jgi:hypothetical protein
MLRSHFWQILKGQTHERKPEASTIDALDFSRQLVNLQEALHCERADPVEALVNVSPEAAPVLASGEKGA